MFIACVCFCCLLFCLLYLVMNLTKQKKHEFCGQNEILCVFVFSLSFLNFEAQRESWKWKIKKCVFFHQSKEERGAGGNCGQLCIFGASIINLIKLFTKNPGEKWQLATQVNLAFFNFFFFVFFIFIFSLVLFSSFVYTIYLLQVLVVAVLLLLLLCSLLLLLLLLLFFPLVVLVVVVVVDCSYFSF